MYGIPNIFIIFQKEKLFFSLTNLTREIILLNNSNVSKSLRNSACIVPKFLILNKKKKQGKYFYFHLVLVWLFRRSIIRELRWGWYSFLKHSWFKNKPAVSYDNVHSFALLKQNLNCHFVLIYINKTVHWRRRFAKPDSYNAVCSRRVLAVSLILKGFMLGLITLSRTSVKWVNLIYFSATPLLEQ